MSTFKGKIGLGAAVLVLAVTTLFYLLVLPPWANEVEERALGDVERAVELVQRIQRVRAYDLVALAQQIALRTSLVDALLVEEERARRQQVFAQIAEHDRRLRERGRKAHFFAVLDAQGNVIARDLNIEAMYGETLPYPSVERALAGRATSDVWFMKNRMMRAAAAPITDQGQVIGAVTIAYDFTAAEAREEADQISTDVVYFLDSAVRASSFFIGTSEDSAKVKRVSGKLTDASSPASQAVGEGKYSDPFPLDVAGEEHLVIAGPLPEAVNILGIQLTTKLLEGGRRAETISGTTRHKVGFAVLVNVDQRLAGVNRARWVALLFGLIFLVIVFGAMWGVARHFVDAEDQLELGVNEVISGNMDYTFDTLQEFEGLANALNVMLARLLGRPEPGEDEEGESAWRAEVIAIEDVRTPATGIDLQQLAAEDEATYYARIYREYVEARQAANLPVDGITLDSFTQKVKANEAMLRAKHKCSLMRFAVNAAGGKVSLIPVRIS